MEETTPRDASGTTDDDPGAGPPPGTAGTIRCEQCGETVPDLTYCVRCGDPLGPEQRKGRQGRVRDTYAAMPGERANSLRLVSTIYPSLPREEIRTFQIALVGGTILVALLGILGLFPVAIAAAAILVPLITIIYVYDVDVYEDEPIRVIAATFLWGALTGALFAYVLQHWFPVTISDVVGGMGSAISGGGGGTPFPFIRGVIAPIVAVVIMVAGPLVLLTYKRFNDVLDGATFGVASGVAFVGAQTLVTALNLFASGLRPAGDPVPWVVRLLVLGVGTPVIAAGAIGGLCGALWLRYRAPVKDHGRLGPVGQPVVAFLVAAALMVVAALTEALLPNHLVGELIALIVIAVLAVVALLWLRRVIHVGLLQEADEIPIGPPIACPECAKQTPRHTYCGNCGTSLKALPRSRQPFVASGPAVGADRSGRVTEPALPDLTGAPTGIATAVAADAAIASVAAPRKRGWLDQRAILALFALVLLGVVLVAAVIAFAQGQRRDLPPCPDPELPCAGFALPVSARAAITADQSDGRHPFSNWQPYADAATGFSVEFDPDIWSISRQSDGFLVLEALGGNVSLAFDVGRAGDWTPEALKGAHKDGWSERLLGFADDTEPARALLGDAILGYRDGVGGLYSGTIDTSQGPTIDMTVAIIAATDDQVTAAAVLLTPVALPLQSGEMLEIRSFALHVADDVINSFTWPTDEVVQ